MAPLPSIERQKFQCVSDGVELMAGRFMR